jgi:DsbE subfamily thiol:disulfide oxidoreductase
MRRVFFLLPLALVVVLGAVFLYRLNLIERGRAPNVLPSAMIDKPAPDFALAALKPDKPGVSSDALKGQVTLVNFFASWCVPCRIEHPLFMRLAAQGDLNLVGVNYKDKPDDAVKWLAQLGDPYRAIGTDRDGRVAIDFGLYGVPETYLIDRTGKIRFRQVGPLTEQVWTEQLAPLLAELRK